MQTVSGAAPTNGLTPELAAIALTLADHDTPVWLDPSLAANAAVIAWLRFQTGAPLTDDTPRRISRWWPIAAQMTALDSFRAGLGRVSGSVDDRSCMALPALTVAHTLTLRGPGIKDTRAIAPSAIAAIVRRAVGGQPACCFRAASMCILVAQGRSPACRARTRIVEG